MDCENSGWCVGCDPDNCHGCHTAQPEAPAVAEIAIEPDYWHRGHYYEGHNKIVRSIDISDLPVGTKLCVCKVKND